MTEERAWLGYPHLGVLAALRDGKTRGRSELAAGQYPAIHPALFLPRSGSIVAILTVLVQHGLVERTTSGGPKSKARPLYRILPEGETTIDAWLARH